MPDFLTWMQVRISNFHVPPPHLDPHTTPRMPFDHTSAPASPISAAQCYFRDEQGAGAGWVGGGGGGNDPTGSHALGRGLHARSRPWPVLCQSVSLTISTSTSPISLCGISGGAGDRP